MFTGIKVGIRTNIILSFSLLLGRNQIMTATL